MNNSDNYTIPEVMRSIAKQSITPEKITVGAIYESLCNHDWVPVTLREGEVVAYLCVKCDMSIPADDWM